jgi:beta,beta-carotene 9',10'-dioxygenase
MVLVEDSEMLTTLTDHRPGFESLAEETTIDSLPVEGELPAWLAGALLRTGPAQFEVGARSYAHWFEGLAMLHRFGFAAGRVSYRNRFLQTRAYLAARDQGRIAYSDFATDPCRSLFRRVVTAFTPPQFGDNANINLIRLGDEFQALTETPLPVVFDPQTLETLGVGQPAPGQLRSAHPHRHPRTGEFVGYATHFGPHTTYRVYAQSPGDGRRMIAKLPARRPAYMHSFAITERYAVLAEFPLIVMPIAIPLSARPFIENYRWRPERGTRFRVIDLDSGKLRGTYESEACFAFHHVNAFEQDGELAIDLCAYDDAEIVQALYLRRLREPNPQLPGPQLHRYRLDLDSGHVRAEQLAGDGLELPRINYRRCNGQPYRYVYGTGAASDGGFLDRIIKADVERHRTTTWHEPGTYPGEPVFVAAPDARGEDAGVLLSIVLDAAAGGSFLLVLDAQDLHELARARVPHRIPFGLHGDFTTEARETTRTAPNGSL